MEDIENIEVIPDGDPDDRRVDLDTPLESFCLGAAIGSGIACIPVLLTGDLLLFINAAMICFAAGMIRWSVDCTYFINGQKRQIDYSRSIFGFETRYPVCRYDEVHAVAVDGAKRTASRRTNQVRLGSRTLGHSTTTRHWVYWTVLVLTNGQVIQVSDKHEGDLGKANRRAKWMSEEVNAPLVEGMAERGLSISFSGGNVSIHHATSWFGWSLWIDHIPFLAGLISSGAAVIAFGIYNTTLLTGGQ